MSPFLRLVGDDHQNSEMTGVVFDPSGTRMYFSSQRSYPSRPCPTARRPRRASLALGATYEVTGPFRLPPGGVPDSWVYGPPAGERAGRSGAGDVPGLRLGAVRSPLGRVRASVTTDRPAELHAVVRTFDLKRESRGDGTHRPARCPSRSRAGAAASRPAARGCRSLCRSSRRRAVLTVVASATTGPGAWSRTA